MKIFGLMVVKNEADIVAHTLRAATEWCDAVYVLDNGSDDETWDVVQKIARTNPAIVPHGQSFEPYTEFIRADLFNTYSKRAKDGDWWCKLDSDEIYVESPRAFLAPITAHDVVWAITLNYYFTDFDLSQYNLNPGLYDSSIPPAQRYHYYRAAWSEIRFFRHRHRLRWDTGAWPHHLGRVFPRRILLRHYQFRSPSQIQKRLGTRSAVFERGGVGGDHWRETDWMSEIQKKESLHYDAGDEKFAIDEMSLPYHKDPCWKGAIKSVMHGTGLWP